MTKGKKRYYFFMETRPPSLAAGMSVLGGFYWCEGQPAVVSNGSHWLSLSMILQQRYAVHFGDLRVFNLMPPKILRFTIIREVVIDLVVIE